MAHEERQSFDPEVVHRYFDGDLDGAARRDVEALLERSAGARDMLEALERQSALLRGAGVGWEGQLSAKNSEDLFAKIEAELDAETPSAPSGKPSLRAIPGGRGRIYAAVTVVLAAAAAALLWLREPRTEPDGGTHEAPIASHVRGSEVIAVDFGENAGTLFNVEGQAGEALAVVWISDQVETP